MSELDELDRRILLQLQQNANLTNQELAEKVHASAPTCLRRVQRLHKSGFIHRQVAILNPQAFAASLQAIVEITLDKQHSEAMAAFELWVKEDAAVLQCYRVSPGPDFVLMVPGIRPPGSEVGDQKRVMTPKEAMEAGATHLVIGRPITGAADPAAAARQPDERTGRPAPVAAQAHGRRRVRGKRLLRLRL